MIRFLAGFALFVSITIWAHAMESNMAAPYTAEPARPHDSKFVFFSKKTDDLIFSGTEPIEIICRVGYRNVSLDWSLSRNRFVKPFLSGQAEALPGNAFKITLPSAKLKAGFYDLRVSLDLGNGKVVPGICVFGYRVDEMTITPDRPEDFLGFWEKAKKELATIELDPQTGKSKTYSNDEINAYNLSSASLPADYDPKGHRCDQVEAFKVNFAGAAGQRVYGWVAKPKGKGPFPAMLILPGAGFGPRPIPLEHARHGFLALDIQVHGQEVDQAEYPKIPGYYGDFVFDPPEDYYFRKVYQNALQAVNYLCSRTDWDQKHLVVVGGSQGGRLSVVVAGLDKRVSAAIPSIAHCGNEPYLRWSRESNAAKPPKDGMSQDGPPPLPDTPEGKCLGYYDPMNFAQEVRCPVFMNMGLVDPISDPTGVYSIYRNIASPQKEMIVLPSLGHDWSAEFDRRAWRWLDRVLDLPSISADPAKPGDWP